MKKYKQLINYNINGKGGPISNLCFQNDIYNFDLLAEWLRYLPYGRTTSRTNLSQLFSENKGTCSSKHGLFKTVAIENNFQEFKLLIGLYKMNSVNTPGIKNALGKFEVEYMPEAHSYIRVGEETIDLTNANSSFDRIKSDVIEELEIEPHQIGQFKVEYHREFIQNWIITNQIKMQFDEVWKIREQCIFNLSN